ncbi:uncharacterized protein LOC126370132 [Pectinophora gossypiella]|uniref:uncharacterized protein LOC126370132 n=1 Tax=Pectinophora gossypiella TaxID=13191 RepID=UPI00214EAA9D|nr:uncharacterized protein LOC126370132 [Pectinophora gossypiella]
MFLSDSSSDNNPLVKVVKYIGFVVLAADIVFVISGFILLIHLYKDGETRLPHFIKCFMYCAGLAIILSFLYGLLYVITCLVIGGSFPIFELTFAFIDLGIWSLWLYFIIVLRSYLHQIDLRLERLRNEFYFAFLDYVEASRGYFYQTFYDFLDSKFFSHFRSIRDRIAEFLTLIGTLFVSIINYMLYFQLSVWVYFLMVVNSYRQNVRS